jgi:hypothetical protein
MEILSKTFHCQDVTFPFMYLGLPMGLVRPNLIAFTSLVKKIGCCLTSASMFLSHASRIQLVNLVLSAQPTSYLCTLKLPVVVILQIDKYRRHCLWRGAYLNARKPQNVAWGITCKPKKPGRVKGPQPHSTKWRAPDEKHEQVLQQAQSPLGEPSLRQPLSIGYAPLGFQEKASFGGRIC